MLRGLAHYRVLRGLARGGQGDVLLALDTRLNRRVCIKLYHYEGGMRERRRLQQEAWRLASVGCPQIVEVLDVAAHGGCLALVTRFVPGCDLARLLDDVGTLPAEVAVAIVSDIAAALAALRRVRLVHGDLSARNILIGDHGRAIIADLGTAIRAGQRVPGCADAALSPEQDRGLPADLRSDFFALGLLLHRMLTGEHPFYAQGNLDRRALQRGLREPPALAALAAEVREPLQALLLDLLAAAPQRRPSGTFVLRERLRVLRALLPAPPNAGPRALALGRSAPPVDVALRLPPRLVRLPWWRQLGAATAAYWTAGSPGARALLVLAGVLPVAVAGLVIAQPGPCIAVLPPQLGAGGADLHALPRAERAEILLTSALKEQARGALVLGGGPHSDSRWVLGAHGAQNICVAQRSVALRVDCADGHCTLDLLARRPEGARQGRLALPARASRQELLVAIDQLVREQAPYLLD